MLYNVVVLVSIAQQMNQLYVYIYPFSFGFPSHLCHHNTLSRVPCIIQYIIINYFNTLNTCIYIFDKHNIFKSLSVVPVV